MSEFFWIIVVVFSSIFIIPFIFSAFMELSQQKNKAGKTKELEQTLADFQEQFFKQQERLEKRISNLETIVTSQTWDVLHDSKLNSDEKKLLTQTLHSEVEELKDGLSDTRKVELLVGRLK